MVVVTCDAGDLGPRRGLPPHGYPKAIRVNQGSQFTSMELDLWAYGNGVVLDFSRPGKPTDSAYAESFNATVRMECLGQHWFMDIPAAQEKVEDWRREYNEVRPHGAIGDRAPLAMLTRLGAEARATNQPEILICSGPGSGWDQDGREMPLGRSRLG